MKIYQALKTRETNQLTYLFLIRKGDSYKGSMYDPFVGRVDPSYHISCNYPDSDFYDKLIYTEEDK